MILRPHLSHVKHIGFYLGTVLTGLGLVMLVPFLLGVFVFKELAPAFDFLLGAEITLVAGLSLRRSCRSEDGHMTLIEGMVVVSLSWLMAMIFSAIPLIMSGHYHSFLDACFETMSCLATTGLTLVQDLDHLSLTHNLWRHLVPFIGGQGIAIVALALFVKGASGGVAMYLGEARDEKILPNIMQTSRFIWSISLAYLFVGTVSLGITGMSIGMQPGSAFFHGACVFMATFDTAGFAPRSQSLLYYHSAAYEAVAMVFMVLGALNFNLQYQIYKGNCREAVKNIETRMFLLSVLFTFVVVMIGLDRMGVYAGWFTMFRKGFFQLVSGHTTTGYQTIYARQFINEWGDLALIGIIIAMAFGGCACSTAGGIKMLRLGVIAKALRADIKKIALTEHTVVQAKFQHIKTLFLNDGQVRMALMITLMYVGVGFLGAMVGAWCGYPALDSLFESVSALGNVGFSCGVTEQGMPAVLKITYILQMWMGRLEFMSVFALFGFIGALIKGK
jgi:trk system potassium uptake protein TrkH